MVILTPDTTLTRNKDNSKRRSANQKDKRTLRSKKLKKQDINTESEPTADVKTSLNNIAKIQDIFNIGMLNS